MCLFVLGLALGFFRGFLRCEEELGLQGLRPFGEKGAGGVCLFLETAGLGKGTEELGCRLSLRFSGWV